MKVQKILRKTVLLQCQDTIYHFAFKNLLDGLHNILGDTFFPQFSQHSVNAILLFPH